MKDKLKPCPFCGCEKIQISNRYVLCVQCQECLAIASFSDMPPGSKDIETLIEKWNRRAK
jgi:Lar family restriction alleviation protein